MFKHVLYVIMDGNIFDILEPTLWLRDPLGYKRSVDVFFMPRLISFFFILNLFRLKSFSDVDFQFFWASVASLLNLNCQFFETWLH